MNNREYDYLFKLVIIGNSGVGKSSVLLRFSDDNFSESYLTTIGVDFRFKTLQIDGKKVKLQIWDTAGQERFRTITNAYYKGANGIVLVYDTMDQNSFKDIEKFWLNEVQSYGEKDVELTLLGNKCDVADKKQVNTEEAQQYADSRKMEFFETSAKTSENVEDAFMSIARKLMVKRDQEIALKKQKKKERRLQKEGGKAGSSQQMGSSDLSSEASNTADESQTQSQGQQESQEVNGGQRLKLNRNDKNDKEKKTKKGLADCGCM